MKSKRRMKRPFRQQRLRKRRAELSSRRHLLFEALERRELLAVDAVVSLQRPTFDGAVAQFAVEIDFSATAGEELVFFSLDAAPSSPTLIGPGPDFSAFSFTASPELDDWAQIGFFNDPFFESTVEFDDALDTPLASGTYTLGTLSVDFGAAGVNFGDIFTVSVEGFDTVIGVEDAGGFRFEPVSFDPGEQTVLPVTASGASNVDEGAPYSLTIETLVSSGFDIIIDWDDGSVETIDVGDLPPSGEVLHTYADGLTTPTILVDVETTSGTRAAASQLELTVNNVSPTVDLSGAANVAEGSPYTLTIGPVTDPGVDTVTQYVIHWGDGQIDTIDAENLPADGQLTHTYADGVTNPTILVDLVDEDGTHEGAGTLGVTVDNVAPTVTLSGATSVDEGALYTLTIGDVFDPGDDTVTQYVVDWGDGLPETIIAAALPASREVPHTFADGVSHPTIRVDLVDEDGTHADAGALNITVNNVAPTVDLSGESSVDEGSLYILTIGEITDPGDDTVTEYVVHWGDGEQQTIDAEDLPINGEVTHTYADGPLSPTIVVDLIDEDGTHFGAGTLEITVANVYPTVDLSGDSSVDEGLPYTLNIGGISDPGDDTVTQYVVDWGDGAQQWIDATDLPADGQLTHAYADGPSNPTIAVDLVDEDGTHHDAGLLDVVVNNVTPMVDLGGETSVDEGSLYTLTIGAITDPGEDTVTQYVVHWGDDEQQTIEAGDLPAGGEVTHTYADGPSSARIVVDLIDEDGTHLSAGLLDITVNNVAPIVDLSGDSVVDEGSPYTLTLGAITDPGVDTVTQYVIDWGDGPQQTINAANLPAGGELSHTYADGLTSPTIRVDLVDEDGAHAGAGSLSITVNNVSPTVDLSGQSSVDEGSLYILAIGDITDPGTDSVTQYVVHWGDGEQDTIDVEDLPSSGEVTHTYADGLSSPTIVVDLVDEDGTHAGAGVLDVTVDNVAPTVALRGEDHVDEGSPYTLIIGAVSDPGDDTVTQYIIDWGDGLQQTIEAEDLPADGEVSHTFADGITNPTIIVDLVDEDGRHVDAGVLEVTVDNVPPTVELRGPSSVDEGSLYILTIGKITDPGNDSVLQYVVHWGDGAQRSIEAADLPASGQVTYTYADGPSSPTIVVDLVDEDGTHLSAGLLEITVENVAPTVALSGQSSVDEGAPYTLTISSVSDPGEDTVTQYVVHWGDGLQQTIDAADLPAGGEVNHTYADGLTNPTIRVDLVDEDGIHVDAGLLGITVDNVAPTVALSGDVSVNEGSPYTLTIDAVSDPGDDTVTEYIVHWGDGQEETISTADLPASGEVTHTYADGLSSPTIVVDLVDEDGTHLGAGLQALTVQNVSPTVALAGESSVDEGSPYTLTIGAVSDPGTDTVTRYVIDWGDGQQQTINAADLPASGEVNHTYADGLTSPTIRVDLVDEDGTHEGAGLLDVTVNNVAPTVALSGESSVAEGSLYILTVGTVTDPGADSVTQYVVHWGDGEEQTIDAADLPASGEVTHTYADGLSNPMIVVDLVDEDGTHAGAGLLDVTVENVSPTVDLSGESSVDEGSPFTLTIGAVSDPGDDTVIQYIIDWCDDGQQTINAADLPASGEVTHTFADGPTSQVVVVHLVDEDGTHLGAGVINIAVNNVAPTSTLDPVDEIFENGLATLTGTIADPGTLDTFTLDINWGDPLSPDNSQTYTFEASASGSQTFELTHQYLDDPAGSSQGTYSISATVTDGDAHSGSDSTTVLVNNVPPVVDPISGVTAAVRGQTVQFTGGFSDVSSQDTHQLDWVVTRHPAAGEDMCDEHGKPLELTMAYTGNNDFNNSQGSKASFEGELNGQPTVAIIAASKDDGSGDRYFTGKVNLGETFTISAGDDKFSSETFILFFDTLSVGAGGEPLPGAEPLKTVEIHTSCSAPLILGEQFGGAQLFGYLGEEGTGGSLSDDPVQVAGGSGDRFSFIPTKIGTYTVTFTVTDDDGGVDVDSLEVEVSRTLIAPNPDNPSETVLFVGGSLGDDHIDLKKGSDGGTDGKSDGGTDGGADIPSSIKVTIDEKDRKLKLTETFPAELDRIIVFGQAGDDDIKLDSNIEPGIPSQLYGDDGDDKIDGGLGDNIIFGGAGNDDLTGGRGSDLLIGGDGKDKLHGGSDGGTDGGRDILIGGRGKDDLKGGKGDDILIGGFMDYDSDLNQLLNIRSEWNSADSYADRVDRLLSGSGSTGAQLQPLTSVHDDDVKDKLNGDKGLDWLLGDPEDDDIKDGKDEIVTDIDPPALHASQIGTAASAPALTGADLEAAFDQATGVWGLTGIDLAPLENVTVRAVDLPGTQLGVIFNNVVLIDASAAGFGWQTDTLTDPQPDSDRMDLLTVVAHELGHLLGLEHTRDGHGVMAERLSAGVRALPDGEDVSQLHAEAADLLFQDLAEGEHPELMLDAF